VDLVGQDDPHNGLVRDLGQVAEIVRLALAPGSAIVGIDAIRASLDDRRNLVAEVGPDPLEHRHASAAFHCVVEQRGNRLRLVAAILEHQACDDEQMREIWDLGAEAPLFALGLVRERDRAQEAFGEARRWCVGQDGRDHEPATSCARAKPWPNDIVTTGGEPLRPGSRS
jgi:hypothetical protein